MRHALCKTLQYILFHFIFSGAMYGRHCYLHIKNRKPTVREALEFEKSAGSGGARI